MAEHGLTHNKIPDVAIAPYQRNTLVERRRVIIQIYADYVCQTEADKDKVTKISA
jgi:hypothetical protein